MRFAKVAGTVSAVLPVIAVLTCLLLFKLGLNQGWGPTVTIAVTMFSGWLLCFVGGVSGILVFILARRNERDGAARRALCGIFLNAAVGFAPAIYIAILVHSVPKVSGTPVTPQGRLDAANQKMDHAVQEVDKFYALDDAAKESFEMGKLDDAAKYANELLMLAPKYLDNWNYGNAVQDGNVVLGRIALRAGHIDEARKRLLAAGNSPGSPQMDSFGPNVSLAKDLLEKGDRDTVLKYLELIGVFWKDDFGKLREWNKQIKAGDIPDFGANLIY